MDDTRRTYYGKYRGTVVNNIDPMQIGRLTAMVPDVLGTTPSSWAMPCLPVAGPQSGMYLVPPVGSGVWVEFEQGDIDYPIWVGCYWGGAVELPGLVKTVPPVINCVALQTTGQNGLMVSDLPGPTGGIVIKSALGATLIVNDTGIFLSNGTGASISLVGTLVTINDGALAVS
jgi:uncharacterized protein involved in type VI secretion and phage assembly